MRILHVLSQTELTGSEVYAAYLGRLQEAEGHEVFYVSDRLHVPVPGKFLPRAISRRSWLWRLKNVNYLKKLCRDLNIDVVHAHSRASSWVSHWATRGGRAAYVSTVHGRQHLHRSTKAYSVYGQRMIAICENVREHLAEDAGFDRARIEMIPNGLCFRDWPAREAMPSTPALSLVGRSSGPKGVRAAAVIETILPELLEKFPTLHFNLAGGLLSNYGPATHAKLADLSARHPGRVHLFNYLPEPELAALIGNSSVVIGSGRLALHAIGRGVPVLALGEAACHGLIGGENLAAAIASNFGDIVAGEEPPVDLSRIGAELAQFFANPRMPAASIAPLVREKFDLGAVGAAVRNVYFQALLEKRLPSRVPILMYHKVVEPGYSSPHKTYIEERAFAGHLRTLNSLGFSSVTFRDLEAAALGHSVLPRKPVVITFDDGYRGTHLRALPLLKRYGQRAVFYLLGDRARAANDWDDADAESSLISDQEVRELAASGMEIGAHSMTHRKMDALSKAEADYEARESKRVLEALGGQRLVSYAYPYGNLSSAAKVAVRDAGFAFGVATDSGGLSIAQDPLQVFRVNMFPHDGPLQVWKKTLRSYRGYYALKRGK